MMIITFVYYSYKNKIVLAMVIYETSSIFAHFCIFFEYARLSMILFVPLENTYILFSGFAPFKGPA